MRVTPTFLATAMVERPRFGAHRARPDDSTSHLLARPIGAANGGRRSILRLTAVGMASPITTGTALPAQSEPRFTA